MDVAALLLDLYDRIPPLVGHAVDGLEPDQLVDAPSPEANTIAWLVWHLARVQDHHVAELLDTDQLWVADGWASRFGRDPDPNDTGYGHTSDQMRGVRPVSASLLIEYLETVAGRTRTMLSGLSADDLDRVVDRSWDPPVTLGVRLISIADDSLQHAGQAAYLRGLLDHGGGT